MARLRSPYRFLDSYRFQDHELFFGREQETKILFADVVVQPLVVLFAKTGTGKTSLINAGVRPLLEAEGYESLVVRVHRDPLRSARAILEERLGEALPADDSLGEQLDVLARRSRNPVVVFFDQFEEFFLYTVRDDYEAAQRFLSDVADIYHDNQSQAHVVLSMREEFFVELDMFRDEIPAIFHEDSNLRLRWFDRDQAIKAIEEPARRQGVTVDPELVRALVDDLMASGRVVLGSTPTTQIEPAQLQIVCDTLWGEDREPGDRLTLERYRTLGMTGREGGIAQRILEHRMYEQFERLESRQQLDLLATLLPRLRTDRGTKRIWDFLSLQQVLSVGESTLRAVLTRLEDAYLVHVSAREGADFIELTHDYFVDRLDELALAVSLVWPRRTLREALQTRGTFLDVEPLVEVLKHIDALGLTSAEGELVLWSAIERRVKLLQQPILALVAAGLDVWQILRERLAKSRSDQEVAYLLETMLGLEAPEALSLLEWALRADRRALSRLQTLARLGTPGALSVLHVALERGWLSGRRISHFPFAETESAVAFFDKALLREELADEARRGLRSLAVSNDELVKGAAKRAIGDEALDLGEIEPPQVAIRPGTRLSRSELSDHYHVVANEIVAGRVVPFLGAGANLCGRPEEVTWRPGQFDWLPSGSELSRYLAQTFKYQGKNEEDLVRVSQYVTLTVGAFPLYEELRRLFDGDYPPTKLHYFLAELPSTLRERRPQAPPYQLIVTSNYDDVLERAFRHAHEPFDLVTYDAEGPYRGKFTHRPHDGPPRTIFEPNMYEDLTADRRSLILKIHGAVDRVDETRDSYVITEDHYIDYLARTDISKLFPITLVRTLRRSHCLFLGYSLRDWNLRVILNRLWGDEKLRSKSWAIQRSPDRLDKELWNRRDVMILDIPLEDYIEGLRNELVRLAKHSHQ